MDSSAPFENRLRKNARHFRRWAKSQQVTAFRVYDRDIPEWPYAVDLYGERAQLIEFPRRRAIESGAAQAQLQAAQELSLRVLEVPEKHLYLKQRTPKVWGKEQYQRASAPADPFVVQEQGLKFEVDLAAHLDTGLFLDHRNTRALVREQAKDARFCNLFAYTGAFSVYAAAGGARSTLSVDLSNTYLDWAERNLRLNGLWDPRQRLERADVLQWIDQAAGSQERFDLIVLDPPSFSTSKKMGRSFDVQRDHPRLLPAVLGLLAPGGTLYFSTNFGGFRLEERALKHARAEELTPRSIPADFHHKEIHRCWRISLR